jgi:DNA polymerase III gamma/tau subunit
MEAFMEARRRMKEDERLADEEEDRRMRAFIASVDERLERAKQEQKRRNAQREGIARRIALDIRRKQDDERAYENMCLELAQQQELERLREREEAEARKIARQHEEARRFMEETMRAKAAQAAYDRMDEQRRIQQAAEQTKRLVELAEIEQEQNRMRIEKFRRELARQMAQKKEMYEAARQEELRKLRLEQEREDERQRILNEERRKLVISHILSMGPEAVKYLPKGVLREEDLDYLPEDYRNAILALPPGATRPPTSAAPRSARRQIFF